MTSNERDPRMNPKQGDRVRANGFEFRVDLVRDEWVYYARFPESDDPYELADKLARVPIKLWREQLAGQQHDERGTRADALHHTDR